MNDEIAIPPLPPGATRLFDEAPARVPGAAWKPEAPIDSETEYERNLITVIEKIHRDAQRAAQPYVDLLVQLRARRPLPPFLLTRDEAERAGLLLPPEIRA